MIAIENVYYLLCYAWNKLDEAHVVRVNIDDEKDIQNLLARVLINALHAIIARGTDRSYREIEEYTDRPRGRIDFARVARSVSRPSRLPCRIDILNADTAANQVIRATALHLLKSRGVATENRMRLMELEAHLRDVTTVAIGAVQLRRARLNAPFQLYQLAIDVCELVYSCCMIEQHTGRVTFRSFVGNRRQMANLYEKFLLNFYRREQSVYSVRAPHLSWCDSGGTSEDMSLLPSMETDVVLTSASRSIVIDAKFYLEPFRVHHGHAKLRSEHLYQIMAYVRNSAHLPNVEGLLLYATSAPRETIDLQLEKMRVRVGFLDLSQPWRRIETALLSLVGILDSRSTTIAKMSDS